MTHDGHLTSTEHAIKGPALRPKDVWSIAQCDTVLQTVNVERHSGYQIRGMEPAGSVEVFDTDGKTRPVPLCFDELDPATEHAVTIDVMRFRDDVLEWTGAGHDRPSKPRFEVREETQGPVVHLVGVLVPIGVRGLLRDL